MKKRLIRFLFCPMLLSSCIAGLPDWLPPIGDKTCPMIGRPLVNGELLLPTVAYEDTAKVTFLLPDGSEVVPPPSEGESFSSGLHMYTDGFVTGEGASRQIYFKKSFSAWSLVRKDGSHVGDRESFVVKATYKGVTKEFAIAGTKPDTCSQTHTFAFTFEGASHKIAGNLVPYPTVMGWPAHSMPHFPGEVLDPKLLAPKVFFYNTLDRSGYFENNNEVLQNVHLGHFENLFKETSSGDAVMHESHPPILVDEKGETVGTEDFQGGADKFVGKKLRWVGSFSKASDNDRSIDRGQRGEYQVGSIGPHWFYLEL